MYVVAIWLLNVMPGARRALGALESPKRGNQPSRSRFQAYLPKKFQLPGLEITLKTVKTVGELLWEDYGIYGGYVQEKGRAPFEARPTLFWLLMIRRLQAERAVAPPPVP